MRAILLLVSALLVGCAGCETHPVNPPVPGIAGAGGMLVIVDTCDAACANLIKMNCPEAATVDGVTCSDLCRQIVSITAAAQCVANAKSCNEANNCTDAGTGGTGN